MRRMRDAYIYAVAIVLAGAAVGIGISQGAEEFALRRNRYAIAAVGNTVAVLDVRNGHVQTFRRTQGLFLYQGTDSRGIAEKRQDDWNKMRRRVPRR
jgi:hypothetical protein